MYYTDTVYTLYRHSGDRRLSRFPNKLAIVVLQM